MSTKMTILLPDDIAISLKRVAGEGKASAYIARAIQQRILEEDLAKIAEHEARHGSNEQAFYNDFSEGDFFR